MISGAAADVDATSDVGGTSGAAAGVGVTSGAEGVGVTSGVTSDGASPACAEPSSALNRTQTKNVLHLSPWPISPPPGELGVAA